MSTNSLSSLSKGCVKLTQLSSTGFVSPHQLEVFRSSHLKDQFLGCTVESFGYVQCFFSSPKRSVQEDTRGLNAKPCAPSDTRESLRSPSVSFAFTTKGFCPNRAGFVSVLAELFSCTNNARVKQTRSLSHLTCSNKLKFHRHTAGKPSAQLTSLRTKICLCEAPPTPL